MSGFADLLGSLLQTGLSSSTGKRLNNAFGSASRSGGLGDLVGSLEEMIGGQAGKAGNLRDVLGSVMSDLGNNRAALGGLGALGGALFGGGGKSARGAIGGGALAMLASLAFSALKQSGQQPSGTPGALLDAQEPGHRQELEENAHILVRAMINAAKADGAIDSQEMQNIVGKLEEDGLSQDEKDFFIQEASRPLDLQGVIDSAVGRPELAAQIYAASLLAIEVDTPEEEQYMQQLADGLQLGDEAIRYIDESLGMAR